MAKILKFKKSNKRILEELKEDAKRELNLLYYITQGFQFPIPPIYNEEEMQSFYDGSIEW